VLDGRRTAFSRAQTFAGTPSERSTFAPTASCCGPVVQCTTGVRCSTAPQSRTAMCARSERSAAPRPSTRTATTSQPRNLLSIARLNSARSRVRPSICSFVRIDQTWLCRSGGFGPTSLPLFQGGRRDGFAELVGSLSFMISLPVRRTDQFAMGTPRAGTIVSFQAVAAKLWLRLDVGRDANDP